MNMIFKLIAILGLAATAISPLLVFFGVLDVSTNKGVMIGGMIAWFVGAIPWLGAKQLEPADTQVEI